MSEIFEKECISTTLNITSWQHHFKNQRHFSQFDVHHLGNHLKNHQNQSIAKHVIFLCVYLFGCELTVT